MYKASRTIFSLYLAVLAGGAFHAASVPYPQAEFVANISSSAPDWRPHKAYNADEAQILTAIYEGLFTYDPYNLDPVPALAESWTVSKNSLEWTFRIRKGAKFENGDPITAVEIRASWLNLLAPASAAPYASLFDSIAGAAEYRSGTNLKSSSVGITAPDAHTLVVRLVTPTEHLPKILCHHAFSVVHPSELKQTNNSGEDPSFRPVSSGAFKIESVSESEIVLVKNPEYWDNANVFLPSIRLLLSDDPETLTARFNRGEINWLAGSSVVDRVVDPSSIHITPMFSTEYFFFRSTLGPGADSRIRNALLLAVPWKELRANYLIPAKTLVFPIAGYPELDGINIENLEEAKKKLLEAGVTDPASRPPLVISIPESQNFLSLAKILEKAWTALGFRVEIRNQPYATYYGSLRENDYTVGITSWIGDFADPLSFLEIFRPTSSLNDSGWNSPGYEALIVDASGQKLVKNRYAKLAEAEKLLLSEGVILPVAHNPSLNVIDMNGITGWYTNALDIHPFKSVRFSQKRALPGVAVLSRRIGNGGL